jgi:hypothetical protein
MSVTEYEYPRHLPLKFVRNMFIKDPQSVIKQCRESSDRKLALETLRVLGIPTEEMRKVVLSGDADINIDIAGDWYFIDHRPIRNLKARIVQRVMNRMREANET